MRVVWLWGYQGAWVKVTWQSRWYNRDLKG